ncbi:MAG TPA: adenylyltransferase/cytidyltransferase family protein [Candidatus Acidoferrales bacterium]|nr:adenylyltransferase/cytidyltransferase family protein [Candidatus Acidoferrales bacterium]
MNTRAKILTRSEVAGRLEEHRKNDQKIVMANGCFDILHAGHVRYLEAARREGDLLVVAINSDSSTRKLKGQGRPILKELDRAELVAALGAVDYVLVFEEPDVRSLLRELRPDVHAKGTDYTVENVPERDEASRLGIRVAIVGDPKDHSTRSLIERIRDSQQG